MTTRDELVAHTPGRVWLRVCGGGITMPSGKSYMTLVGDNRPQDRHTEYVRADLASRQEVSVETPRVADNDRDEITVTLDGKELRGWSYSSDQERRTKMLCAREYVEGFCTGRQS